MVEYKYLKQHAPAGVYVLPSHDGLRVLYGVLFVHRGQVDPKELRFHPQVPGVIARTAADGFNVFLCESLAPSRAAREKLADAAEAAEAAAMARAGIRPAAANGAPPPAPAQ